MDFDRSDPNGSPEAQIRPAPLDVGHGSSPSLPGVHRPWQALLSDAEAERVAADMTRQGYGVLGRFVSERELDPVRAVIRAAADVARGEYFDFRGPDALAGTILADLPQAPAFGRFCRRLYELGTGRPFPEEDFYQVLRCLQGHTGQTRSWYFHYDSSVVTALLPVAMPSEGAPGDLVIIPNTRRIRRFYLTNLLDKLLLDTRLAQVALRSTARRGRLNSISVRLRPGDLYFFWGYRSIHTNEACDSDKLRATALLHYGDPHRNSRLRRLIQGGVQGASST